MSQSVDKIEIVTVQEILEQKKRLELADLETELVQKELDLTTLNAELHNFEREYTQIIGSRYAELEDIEAQISEYMA